jgi:hypothetical protein
MRLLFFHVDVVDESSMGTIFGELKAMREPGNVLHSEWLQHRATSGASSVLLFLDNNRHECDTAMQDF